MAGSGVTKTDQYDSEGQKAASPAGLPAGDVPGLVARAFADMPGQPAAEFQGLTLSRSELAETSDRLAAWLLRHSGGPGALVGIYMDRCPEMLVAILGVLKAGAAYVPLDPMFPAARIEQIVAETQVPVMLVTSRTLETLPPSTASVLALDASADVLAREPTADLPTIAPDDRAYVIFTSGSTGRPKGVEVTHGAVVNLLTDLSSRLEMKPSDRWLAVTTLSFDISVLEMLLPLTSGGTVVIARRDDAADGARLMEMVRTTQSTLLQATPVTWRMLLEHGFTAPPGFKMLCGGEAWTQAVADRLLESSTESLGSAQAPPARLWNMYGPTETTVWSSATEVYAGAAAITMGAPISNTRFYVLDAEMHPVTTDDIGELFIAGGGVARGYFQRPQLTAEKFLADPFFPGERMYRTGDEVRQVGDGSIEYIGRLDQQVKLRGFRIELGEIETALRALPEIVDAAAALRQDANGEAMLAGYYTASQDVASAVLRDALRARLPLYMVPTAFKRLESLPLTANGKLDRRALPEVRAGGEAEAFAAAAQMEPNAAERSQSETPASNPEIAATPAERDLMRIWSQIFQVENLTPQSDFFDLGGHSLLLARLQIALSKEFNVRLTTADLFRAPTIAALAAWLDLARAAEAGKAALPPATDPHIVPIQPHGTARPIFVISQSMIFRTLAGEMGPDQPVYALQMLEEETAAASTSFDDLIDFYLRLIRQVQPTGPYRIAGWCVSGWIAYGLARRLEQEGDSIELLLILDVWAPHYWYDQRRLRRRMMLGVYRVQRLRSLLYRLRRSGRLRKESYLYRNVTSVATVAQKAFAKFHRPDAESDEMEELGRTLHIQRIASNAAFSGPLQGNVLVFRSEEEPPGPLLAPDMGWGRVMGRNVHVEMLRGDHREIFSLPGAGTIATRAHEVLGSRISSAAVLDARGNNPQHRRANETVPVRGN